MFTYSLLSCRIKAANHAINFAEGWPLDQVCNGRVIEGFVDKVS